MSLCRTIGPLVSITDGLWVGRTDALQEGEWRWIPTMETFTSANITDWYSGQADDGSGTEECLELKLQYDFSWNDDQFYSQHKFICEIDMD